MPSDADKPRPAPIRSLNHARIREAGGDGGMAFGYAGGSNYDDNFPTIFEACGLGRDGNAYLVKGPGTGVTRTPAYDVDYADGQGTKAADRTAVHPGGPGQVPSIRKEAATQCAFSGGADAVAAPQRAMSRETMEALGLGRGVNSKGLEGAPEVNMNTLEVGAVVTLTVPFASHM